jgi:hypothetical protein
MTPTISPSTVVLPQQPITGTCNPTPPPLAGQGPAPAGAPMTSAATGGGAIQAVEGVSAVQGAQGTVATAEQLIPILQNLIAAIEQLIPLLQQQAAVSGGGAIQQGGGCGCGMPGCTHGAGMAMGARGAPTAPQSTSQAAAGAHAMGDVPMGNVDPSTVKDKTSTRGLTAAPLRGLDVAHRFGLPLVSGHRPGGPSSSDHTHGDAIDVGTLAIGAASSTEGTPQMKAYAEYMRQAGKRGELNVKYVILDGKIASPRDNWEWRPYTYPGKSSGEIEALKQSNRGEYNRIQHYDHVHVSFK